MLLTLNGCCLLDFTHAKINFVTVSYFNAYEVYVPILLGYLNVSIFKGRILVRKDNVCGIASAIYSHKK